jgi:hypothetical protein
MYVPGVYLAHSGVALAAKRADTRLPISWCLVAVWAIDLTGIGHWVPLAAVLVAAAFMIGRRRWDSGAGLVLAAAVLSHEALNLVEKVQLLPATRFVGLQLESDTPLELVLELLTIIGGWLLYRATIPTPSRRSPLPLVPLATMAAFSVARFFVFEDDPTPFAVAVGVAGMVTMWLTVVLVDRRVRDTTEAPPLQ